MDENTSPSPGKPSNDSIYRQLMFGLTLPERTVRSAAAVISGAAGESAAVLLPQFFQNSKTYRTFVQQMIDMLASDVGGVASSDAQADTVSQEATNADGEPSATQNYIAQKTVGSFVDLAGMAVMHVSPLTVLAIVSDVAHGSKYYLRQLAAELEEQGVIEAGSTVGSTAELLEALGNASGTTVDSLDCPPIDIAGLKDTIQRTQADISKIDPSKLIPQSEITSLWNDMSELATREHVSLFQLSSTVTMYSLDQVSNVTRGALTTVRVTGNLLDDHFFDHYRKGLNEINERGIFTVLSATSRPYIDAVWFNFSDGRPTLTEDLINGKLLNQAIDGVSGWFGKKADDGDSTN